MLSKKALLQEAKEKAKVLPNEPLMWENKVELDHERYCWECE